MSNNSKNHDSVRESYLTVDVSVILEVEHTLSAFKFLKKWHLNLTLTSFNAIVSQMKPIPTAMIRINTGLHYLFVSTVFCDLYTHHDYVKVITFVIQNVFVHNSFTL